MLIPFPARPFNDAAKSAGESGRRAGYRAVSFCRAGRGAGQHVHLFDTDSHQVKSLFLDDYVDHIYSIPDVWDHKASLSENFLVTTFQYTFLIHVSSGIIWRSEPCGIDGVIIHDIREGIIYGSGEWDPPDGWAPFNLRLSDGHRA